MNNLQVSILLINPTKMANAAFSEQITPYRINDIWYMTDIQ